MDLPFRWRIGVYQRRTLPRLKHEPNPLDPSELPRLVKLLDGLKENKPKFANMALLAMNTGMCRGELCALK